MRSNSNNTLHEILSKAAAMNSASHYFLLWLGAFECVVCPADEVLCELLEEEDLAVRPVCELRETDVLFA